ncbi:hypothetical protein QQ045_007926 [Rhodiola kirilowii]
MGACVSHPKHPHASVTSKLQDFNLQEKSHLGSSDETFFDTQPWLESDCDEDFYSVNGDSTPSRGNTPVHHMFSTGSPRVLTHSHGNTPLHPNFPSGAPRLEKASSKSSHTNTPLHNNFAAGTPRGIDVVADKELAGYNPEFSPTSKKKRLSELFRQSRGGYADENIFGDNTSADTNIVQGPVFTPTSVNSSPFISGHSSIRSSERTSNGNIKPERNKALKSAHPSCCLPKLLSVRHKDERGMDVSPI